MHISSMGISCFRFGVLLLSVTKIRGVELVTNPLCAV